MLIKGLEKTSLSDWEEKIAAVIFTGGCNFRCGFCFNPELVNAGTRSANMAGRHGAFQQNIPQISEQKIFKFLKKRKNLLDGVCITGGEPLLQNNLAKFISKIKKLGFLVKLDHNGSMPEKLEQLIQDKLIDYVAMDIKAPLSRYQEITRSKIDPKIIKKSINLIINSGTDHEFRSTLVPALHSLQDVINMAKMIKNGKRYFLQNFKNKKTLDKDFEKYKSFNENELKRMAKECSKYIYTEVR